MKKNLALSEINVQVFCFHGSLIPEGSRPLDYGERSTVLFTNLKEDVFVILVFLFIFFRPGLGKLLQLGGGGHIKLFNPGCRT